MPHLGLYKRHQLFMVPEFREGVLAYRDSDFRSDDVDGDDNTPSEERQGRLMWQLQNMFSHLQVRSVEIEKRTTIAFTLDMYFTKLQYFYMREM